MEVIAAHKRNFRFKLDFRARICKRIGTQAGIDFLESILAGFVNFHKFGLSFTDQRGSKFNAVFECLSTECSSQVEEDIDSVNWS